MLSSDVDIYAFGFNLFEQLGIDSFKKNSIPTKINVEKKFIEIAANKDWETCGSANNISLLYSLSISSGVDHLMNLKQNEKIAFY